MPAELISFGPSQATGDSALAGAGALCVNVVIDGAGAVRRRPGLSAYSPIPGTLMPGPVSGIGYFGAEDAVLFVAQDDDENRIYALSGDVFTELSTATTSSRLLGSGRPVFADTKDLAVIIAGNVPQKVTVGLASDRLGGSPPRGDSVAALASRILVDDKSGPTTRGQFRWCDPGVTGTETWDALEVADAEARPDGLVRIAENTNEVWAFGETSLQVYSPDPVSVFTPGRAVNVGCGAAHSVIRVDDQFAWLDNRKRFILSDGRGYQDISGQLATTIEGISTISDCYGFRVDIGQFDCLVWVFPTDGRAFAWQKDGGWCQWQGWGNGTYQPFSVSSHCYIDRQDVHLVGLDTGQIAQFDTAAYTDLGETIKGEARTAFIDHGTLATKECNFLRLVLHRGQAASTAPVLLLSWRDDLGAFCDPLRVSLGTAGDYVHTVELRGLGTYRSRQWRLEMTDAADITVARVEEDFSMGAN